MDGTRFDQLIKGIATQRVTRLTALRGLAVGAIASVTGLSLFGEDGEAKKDGKKKRTRRICHRTSATDPGVNKKLKAKRAKRHLKKHQFDTKGRCAAAPPRVGCQFNTDCPPGQICQNAICVNPQVPNPGVQCGNDQDCAAGLVCRGGRCDFCNNNQECPADQLCIQGQCRGGVNDFLFGLGGEDCDDPGGDCPTPLNCLEASELPGNPNLCLIFEQFYNGRFPGFCPPIDDRECPEIEDFGDDDIDVDSVCVLGACVVLCNTPALEEACEDEGGDCLAGICYQPAF